MKGTARKLAVRLDAANRVFLELKRECESCRILESVSHLSVKLMNLMSEMEDFLEEAGEGETKDRVRDLYFQVRDFLNIYDILDDNYVIYCELETDMSASAGNFMYQMAGLTAETVAVEEMSFLKWIRE